MRGAQKAQPFGHPLDGRVRPRCSGVRARRIDEEKLHIFPHAYLPLPESGPACWEVANNGLSNNQVIRSMPPAIPKDARPTVGPRVLSGKRESIHVPTSQNACDLAVVSRHAPIDMVSRGNSRVDWLTNIAAQPIEITAPMTRKIVRAEVSTSEGW